MLSAMEIVILNTELSDAECFYRTVSEIEKTTAEDKHIASS